MNVDSRLGRLVNVFTVTPVRDYTFSDLGSDNDLIDLCPAAAMYRQYL
jgi:hypothetical protein